MLTHQYIFLSASFISSLNKVWEGGADISIVEVGINEVKFQNMGINNGEFSSVVLDLLCAVEAVGTHQMMVKTSKKNMFIIVPKHENDCHFPGRHLIKCH